jgi:ketose-bisphosphate aldolase
MPLVPMRSLLEQALSRHYAVGYFESWNLESLLSVIHAAEKMKSPVIIGFGGIFLGNPERSYAENILHYGALGQIVAQESAVPVALLLNETNQVALLIRGLKAGFNAIMYQDPAKSFEETISINQYLVRTAHYLGAAVEAEVGELPHADIANRTVCGGSQTDPDQASFFVRQTGIDALAVAVGNVHLQENEKSPLNFGLIERILGQVRIPLVLHGGTGIAADDLKEAIRLGVCKVNVGTSLKRTCLNYLRDRLGREEFSHINPHQLIGQGGPDDLFTGARDLMTEEITRYIQVFGSEGMAD